MCGNRVCCTKRRCLSVLFVAMVDFKLAGSIGWTWPSSRWRRIWPWRRARAARLVQSTNPVYNKKTKNLLVLCLLGWFGSRELFTHLVVEGDSIELLDLADVLVVALGLLDRWIAGLVEQSHLNVAAAGCRLLAIAPRHL